MAGLNLEQLEEDYRRSIRVFSLFSGDVKRCECGNSCGNRKYISSRMHNLTKEEIYQCNNCFGYLYLPSK